MSFASFSSVANHASNVSVHAAEIAAAVASVASIAPIVNWSGRLSRLIALGLIRDLGCFLGMIFWSCKWSFLIKWMNNYKLLINFFDNSLPWLLFRPLNEFDLIDCSSSVKPRNDRSTSESRLTVRGSVLGLFGC